MAIEIRTYRDIQEAVLQRVKEPTTTARSVTIIQELINARYRDVAKLRKWRWRSERRTRRYPSRINTGTASVTNGSRDVTLTGAPNLEPEEDFLGWYFKESAWDERYQIIGVDNTPGSVSISSYQFPSNSLLVFGEESCGLSPTIKSLCQDIVHIDQFGSIRSLNVGVASGIIMHTLVSRLKK